VYTVPMVEEELASNSVAMARFHAALEHGRMKAREPDRKFLDEVKAASKKVGDVLFLSEVDMKVLALALELKGEGYSPVIVTDDYSIQNVANQIGIRFVSLTTFGIRYRMRWVLYCPACYRRFPSDYRNKLCDVCGTEIKRKPLHKTLLRKDK